MATRAWQGAQALLEAAVITGLVALGAALAIGSYRSRQPIDPLGVMGQRLERLKLRLDKEAQ